MPIPTDPLLSTQWHLRNTVAGLLDLNVSGVWNPTQGLAYTGAGIRAFVIDEGIDFTHSDLAPNYNTAIDHDYVTGGNSAFGTAGEPHGTAVAGLIGAAANGSGAVGVAYGAQLAGYRIATIENVRDAIRDAATTGAGDVMNMSLGLGVGSEFVREAVLDEVEAAIGAAVDLGRGRLGTTVVKSAGNERGSAYDVNAGDWGNDTRQVVVAAVDRDGAVSDYSSYGAAVLVSGFGTPGEVVTTDRVGGAGYDPGNFTAEFNGTSSAAPMVTGVVALMVDANAGLGWRDVQSILAASARHVGTAVGGTPVGSEIYAWGWNHAATWNGGGQHFSNDYGYGLVDARAAVRLAESWLLTWTAAATSGNDVTRAVDVLNATVTVPDGNATGVSFSGAIAAADVVDRVTVQMRFSTTYTGDLDLFLTSPDGTVSQLVDNAGSGAAFDGTWTFESQAFRGERADGTWRVRVADTLGGDVLAVSDIVVRTVGTATTADRYVFTNEYSDYDGVAGHRTTISDTNGGTDTVNAAAVSVGASIRLDGSLGSIDGVGVRFAAIENAIGGDGNDGLLGSAAANRLVGMRGNDALVGGGGNDTLDGGDGNDTFGGGDGNDLLVGRAGNDRQIGQAGNDAIHGDLGNDVAQGGLGKDSVFGGGGADLFDFNLAGESPFGAGCDVLQAGGGGNAFDGAGAAAGDRIDLSDLYAGTLTFGVRVWCVNAGAVTRVFANTDGDAAAEFQLDILDIGVLAGDYRAADFIL